MTELTTPVLTERKPGENSWTERKPGENSCSFDTAREPTTSILEPVNQKTNPSLLKQTLSQPIEKETMPSLKMGNDTEPETEHFVSPVDVDYDKEIAREQIRGLENQILENNANILRFLDDCEKHKGQDGSPEESYGVGKVGSVKTSGHGPDSYTTGRLGAGGHDVGKPLGAAEKRKIYKQSDGGKSGRSGANIDDKGSCKTILSHTVSNLSSTTFTSSSVAHGGTKNIQVGNNNTQIMVGGSTGGATNMQVGDRNVQVNIRFSQNSYQAHETGTNVKVEQDYEVLYIKIKRKMRKVESTDYDHAFSHWHESLVTRIPEAKEHEDEESPKEKKHPMEHQDSSDSSCVVYDRISQDLPEDLPSPKKCMWRSASIKYVNIHEAFDRGNMEPILKLIRQEKNLLDFINEGGDDFDVEISTVTDLEGYSEVNARNVVAVDEDDYSLIQNKYMPPMTSSKTPPNQKYPRPPMPRTSLQKQTDQAMRQPMPIPMESSSGRRPPRHINSKKDALTGPEIPPRQLPRGLQEQEDLSDDSDGPAGAFVEHKSNTYKTKPPMVPPKRMPSAQNDYSTMGDLSSKGHKSSGISKSPRLPPRSLHGTDKDQQASSPPKASKLPVPPPKHDTREQSAPKSPSLPPRLYAKSELYGSPPNLHMNSSSDAPPLPPRHSPTPQSTEETSSESDTCSVEELKRLHLHNNRGPCRPEHDSSSSFPTRPPPPPPSEAETLLVRPVGGHGHIGRKQNKDSIKTDSSTKMNVRAETDSNASVAPKRSFPALSSEARVVANSMSISPGKNGSYDSQTSNRERKQSIKSLAGDFEKWYKAKLDRDGSKELLMRRGQEGAFLIRNGSSADPRHRYSLDIYFNGRQERLKILESTDGLLFFDGFPDRTFGCLPTLVEAILTDGVDIKVADEHWHRIKVTEPV